MHYAALASGSKGNCHAFTAEGQTLLVDAGISYLQIRTRMEHLGLDAESIAGVAITHEHSDHIGALPVLLRRTEWAFLMTADTKVAVEACLQIHIPSDRWVPLTAGRSITWGELGAAFAQIVLLLGGLLAAIGIWSFSRRELATAQGTQ